MPKLNPLSQGLKQQARKPEPVAAAPEEVAANPHAVKYNVGAKTVPPSRVGRVLIGGHFAPEVQTALKIVAAEERTSVQSLIAEGINAVFARRHKARIASLSSQTGSQR